MRAKLRNGFSWPLRFFGLLLLVSAICGPAVATEHRVSSSSELRDALRAPADATGSEERVLRLAPGRYAPLVLRGITGPLRLVAEDPANPPELAGLTLRDSSDIRFESLVFRYRPQAEGEPVWTAPFRVLSSRDISFERALFEGAIARGHGAAEDGFPAGVGLRATGVEGLTIRDSEFRGSYIGMQITKAQGFSLLGNDLHGMRKDGINLAQVEDVLIAHNRFHDFRRALAARDHADMIQMWTTRTDKPSVNVTIRDNVFNSGHGSWTQTIFIRNEEVDQGRAGPEMLYRNIRIEQNVIINAHLHGITVGDSDGVVIRNNTLIRNRLSEKPGADEKLSSPRIRVTSRSRNVTVEANAAFAFPKPAGPDWTVRENLVIQADRRLKPGFYGNVFENALRGDPQELQNFHYRRSGPLAESGIGAARLVSGN